MTAFDDRVTGVLRVIDSKVTMIDLREALSVGRWFPSFRPTLGRVAGTLMHLERTGLVESEWDGPTPGERRRLYWLKASQQ